MFGSSFWNSPSIRARQLSAHFHRALPKEYMKRMEKGNISNSLKLRNATYYLSSSLMTNCHTKYILYDGICNNKTSHTPRYFWIWCNCRCCGYVREPVIYVNSGIRPLRGGHYGLTGCPIKTQKCLKKCGMVPKSAEWWQGIWNINFFCQSLKST